MLVENTQRNILFEETNETKLVGLKISGGADSAIVGYMLSKWIKEYRNDIKIVPITTIHAEKPFQEIYSKRVIEFLRNVYGDIFLEHQINTAKKGALYISKQQELVVHAHSNLGVKVTFNGITQNPPPKIVKRMTPGGPTDNRVGPQPSRNDHARFPLININKKGVAELYTKFGLMDSLFPITRSCEAYNYWPDYDVDNHCGRCWWCQERQWGFGRLV